ncbi:MAG: sigma-70 family RNA polymerase sigma factor [Elusimicrobiota bacterium]|nr:sigma-70 family RNA polymerase sigma factor [Elusimicrobiota bacterium]
MPDIDWDALIDANANKAYCFAMGLCGNEDEAKELVQEAFVKAMDRIETHDPNQPFQSWFLTILKNLYLDGTKRYERRVSQPLEQPLDADGLTVADGVADLREMSLLDRLERQEAAKLVRRAMRALTPDARAVLLMIDLEGLGYEETAAVMGCPLNTLRSRIVRARAALKERLLAMEVNL